MLTEILRDETSAIIGITEDALVSMEFGFGWGFDELTEYHPTGQDRARQVFSHARETIRASGGRRFFLFLHTYKVHAPYAPSPAYETLYDGTPPAGDPSEGAVPERFRADRDAYDESISELDDLLAELLKDLDASGLSERTLLVVLSDHGEAFGEHGARGHGLSPYQEALHVPLAFRGPGVMSGLRIATPVSVIDVAPTILDVLGMRVPDCMQGRSLRGALAGEPLAPRPIFFGWVGEHNRGVRFGNWKAFGNDGPLRVVELGADPLERRVRTADVIPPKLATMLQGYDAETAERRARLDEKAAPAAVAPDVAPRTCARSATWNSAGTRVVKLADLPR
jgi:arylsulfatase A-like enzyme